MMCHKTFTFRGDLDSGETIKELSEKITNLVTPLPKPIYNHREKSSQVSSQPPSSQHHGNISSSKDKNKSQKRDSPERRHKGQCNHQNIDGITEWLLPSNICQTRVNGRPMASNACTIIVSPVGESRSGKAVTRLMYKKSAGN